MGWGYLPIFLIKPSSTAPLNTSGTVNIEGNPDQDDCNWIHLLWNKSYLGGSLLWTLLKLGLRNIHGTF